MSHMPRFKRGLMTWDSPVKAFYGGAVSFSMFPDLKDVTARFPRDGLRADWQAVGADMAAAMKKVSTGADRDAA